MYLVAKTENPAMKVEQQAKRIKSKRIIRFGRISLSPVALLLAMFVWYFWSSAGRYHDRFAVLSAMLRLRFTDEKIVFVGGRPDTLLIKTGDQATIDDYLNRSGWSCADWMDAEKQCRQNNQKMRIVNAAMTRCFRIVGLGHAPYSVRGTN